MVPGKAFLKWPETEQQSDKMLGIMKSRTAPYEWFDGYYSLDEIIDKYMEIWDEEEQK